MDNLSSTGHRKVGEQSRRWRRVTSTVPTIAGSRHVVATDMESLATSLLAHDATIAGELDEPLLSWYVNVTCEELLPGELDKQAWTLSFISSMSASCWSLLLSSQTAHATERGHDCSSWASRSPSASSTKLSCLNFLIQCNERMNKQAMQKQAVVLFRAFRLLSPLCSVPDASDTITQGTSGSGHRHLLLGSCAHQRAATGGQRSGIRPFHYIPCIDARR